MDMENISAGCVGFGVVAASLYNGWQAKQSKRQASEANEAAQGARKTLTTNNGGSHVKDALDRIEAAQLRLGADFATHVSTSNDRHQATAEHLARIDAAIAPRRRLLPFL